MKLNTKSEDNLELKIDPETAQLLQIECFKAWRQLFHTEGNAFKYDEIRFASLDDNLHEEERVNAITDNKVRFTFGHKEYLHFELVGCDMLFQMKGKNAYGQVCKEVMRAQDVYSEMVEKYNKMKSVLKMKYASSVGELTSIGNNAIDCIVGKIFETISEYSLALYLQEARTFFNGMLENAFGENSYIIEIGVTENSFLYVTDNSLHKKKSRAIYRKDGEEVVKYLKEGIKAYKKQLGKENNSIFKINNEMKRSFKKTAAEQEVAKKHSNENGIGNIDVTKVANYLCALMQPESEASQMLKIAKMDVSTWLNRITDGLFTCVITYFKLSFFN